MSNIVCIQRTKFINLDNKGNSTSESYGFRMYDNYEFSYNNDFTLSEILLDDLALFKFIRENCIEDQRIADILYFLYENEIGLFIDDSFYEFSEIKNILNFD